MDVVTGIVTGGVTDTFGLNERDRYEWRGDVTHFHEGLGGSHNFKFGVHGEALRTRVLREIASQSDDTHHLLFSNAPYRVRLWNSPLIETGALDRWTFYAQDEWSVGDRLTINAGLRVERTTAFLPESEYPGRAMAAGAHLRGTEGPVRPAGGGAAVRRGMGHRGDRRTVARFSIGRFYHALSGMRCCRRIRPPSATASMTGSLEWRSSVSARRGRYLPERPTGALPGQIDPDLKVPYTNMFLVALERQLGADLAVSISGIYKDSHDIVQILDTNVPFSRYVPVAVPNPLDNQPLTIYTLPVQFQDSRDNGS